MPESVGERIRALRAEQGMTLAELGEKANLSISYLSQIERDKTTPSLATLTGIARAFKVGLRYFFEAENGGAHVLRASDPGHGLAGRGGPVRTCLTSDLGSTAIEVLRVVLPPRVPPERLQSHSGEEFAFVLAGELIISLGDEQFNLQAGDSIHYDALQTHAWSNPSDQPCVVIWACSPARS